MQRNAKTKPAGWPLIASHGIPAPVLRYGLAIGGETIALGLALLCQSLSFRNVEVPLFLSAVAVTAWYAGPGPAALAVFLSGSLFDYFFVVPLHTWWITTSEIPYFVVFLAFAALIAWFSNVRRATERDLLATRDRLQIEVAERSQQASLLDLTHDSISVRDMDFIIQYWNHGAQELYGWKPEQVIGEYAPRLLHTVYPVPESEVRAALERTGRWEGELRRKRADGSSVVVASRWSLRRDEQHRPVAVLETSNDISERKRREEEVQELNGELAKRSGELEASNKELEAFAYSVSHDLRAPLRHMVGYTELLQKKTVSVLDQKSSHYVAMILDSAKRMGNLIDDLLSFSRIGRAETQMGNVNMAQLAREVLNDFRQETEKRKVAWKIGALPSVQGDRSMIRLALVNLLSNALKFTRTREQAEIEIGSMSGTDSKPAIFVRDNGVGFDMKYANKLFGVFQRLHSYESFEGTGIGLATVQRIIHRHGGSVWAEGAVDQGAAFYFSIPEPKG